jgi:hypothetical protein
MRRAASIATVVSLVTASVAVAAGPMITASVTPNTPNAHSKLKVSAKGPFSASGLPTAVQIDAQKGFRASAKSVSAYCNPKSLPCPAGSKIGSGQVVATVTIIVTQTQTIPFNMYLGRPHHTGDIASIVLTAKVFGSPEHVVGRLFTPSGGGLEVLFDHLPGSSVPPGEATLNKLSLSAHAVRKAGKRTYSLITNPPKCTGGHWSGSVTVNFASGPVTQSLAISCSA